MGEGKPIMLVKDSSIEGSRYLGTFAFKSGTEIPVYDLRTTGAFNQIIGHAKFNNRFYGNVYYRGVDSLYDNVLPSIMRNKQHGDARGLVTLLNKVCNDDLLRQSLKLEPKRNDRRIDKKINRHNRYCVEALLQHYSGYTRFLDVVDNHWVALWMGAHDFKAHGKSKLFYKAYKRTIPVENICESVKNNEDLPQKLYVYILLLAMPYSDKLMTNGIKETKEFVEVDLRKTLPSVFLRPHAQHALVVRRRDTNDTYQNSGHYDMASQIIGVLRVRIDVALNWLGNGMLLTQDNLFPSPSTDNGYDTLLNRTDLFVDQFSIKKYF